MAHKDLNILVKEWIRSDENVNADWEIQETEDNQVIVTGKLRINIGTNVFYVTGSSSTLNDNNSIGRAIQTINDGILSNINRF